METKEQKEEKDKRLGGFGILLGVLNLIFFIGMGLSTYGVRMENSVLKEKFLEHETFQLRSDRSQNILLLLHGNRIHDLESDLSIKTVKIGIIEESLDPRNTRWAKVKKVRGAITSVIKEKGYRDTPNVRGLTTIASAVVDYSERYDVEIPLILGVMTRESAFKVKVKSHADAYGLMQMIPDTQEECAADLGRRHYNMYNIRDSVQFGTWYIKKMFDKHEGSLDLTLRAYNCGPDCVHGREVRGWKVPYPEETVLYVPAVLEWKAVYEKMGL